MREAIAYIGPFPERVFSPNCLWKDLISIRLGCQNGSLVDILNSRNYPPDTAERILLFSGGRDSTCAALELIACDESPLLITVVDTPFQSDKLTLQRVQELSDSGQNGFSWVSLSAPEFYQQMLAPDLLTAPSCLPCFFLRLSVAVVFAHKFGIKHISTGFSGYQSTWIEQSDTAIELTRQFLGNYDIQLSLPVRYLSSKEAASRILKEHGLSQTSLEPICHCADTGTQTNGEVDDIESDIEGLTEICHKFIAQRIDNDNISQQREL